jgi:hypothetical protein
MIRLEDCIVLNTQAEIKIASSKAELVLLLQHLEGRHDCRDII